jgi:hypothetical protein
MEKLATDMDFLERSSSTKLRTGISFGSVILTNRDAVVVIVIFGGVATPAAGNRMGIPVRITGH